MAASSPVPALVEQLLPRLDGKRGEKSLQVTCKAVREGSVSKVFHLAMPVGAQVSHLRAKLKPHASPANSYVLANGAYPGVEVLLEETDFLPGAVTISKYEGTVTHDMVLTRNQCYRLQEVLQLLFESKEVQKLMDDMEARSGGSEEKYRWRLGAVLQTEVYPAISRYLGLDDKAGATLPIKALGHHSHSDIRLTESWLKLEVLMRNRATAELAYAQLQRLQGGPEKQLPAVGKPEEERPQADPAMDLSEPKHSSEVFPGKGKTVAEPPGKPREFKHWRAAHWLSLAVEQGEDLLCAELRLSSLLQEQEEQRPRHRAQRAMVRLGMGLFDAALEDAREAGAAEGAAEALVAALTGLQQYEEALRSGNFGRDDEAVREQIRVLQKQSTGKVEWDSAYWATDLPPLLPRVADYCGPVKLDLIGQAGARRRGLFASRALKAGELLLTSRALVHMREAGGRSVAEKQPLLPGLRESNSGAMCVYRRASEVSRHAGHVLGGLLSDGCFRAAPDMRQFCWQARGGVSSGAVDDRVIQGVICTNAFKDLQHSIFPAASMANHSCLPTAVVVKLGNAFALRARRAVEAGAEVTINYFDIMMPLADRVERCKSWHFTCACRRCEVERKIPRSLLVVPISMRDQLARLRNISLAEGSVEEIIEELEETVHGHLGAGTEQSNWVCGSFIDLYAGQAEANKTREAYDRVLQIYEAVHPGSFIHCKLALSGWRQARAEAVQVSTPAPQLWERCVTAHQLRYGECKRSTLLRLMEETRRSVDEGMEEFCMR